MSTLLQGTTMRPSDPHAEPAAAIHEQELRAALRRGVGGFTVLLAAVMALCTLAPTTSVRHAGDCSCPARPGQAE